MALMGTPAGEIELVLDALKRYEILLESDSRLPNVCRIVTGQTMKGSWWSHPQAHAIFAVNEFLADHSDVLMTKLISGKVTFAHRELWRYIYAIGISRDVWQMKNLSVAARALLKKVDKLGSLSANEIGPTFSTKPGDIVRELENRLLLHTEQYHTASGAHSKILERWDNWAKRAGFRPRSTTSTVARRALEQRLEKLNEEFDGKGRLPWT